MPLYNETVGTMTYDNLTNSNDFPLITGLRAIAAGQGELKRGTALAVSASTGKLSVLGAADSEGEDLTPYGILCDDVDATEETTAEVYLSGHFNRGSLITKDGAEITDAQAEEYRKQGIYLDNSMK